MKPAQRLACGGVFQPDTDLPPDHQGRRTCRCGLLGEAGDAHHPETGPVEDAASRAAGEREGD